MPESLLLKDDEQELDNWSGNVKHLLQIYSTAVMAIDTSSFDSTMLDAVHLRKQMAFAVKRIIQHQKINNLFIEGGSTASAILKEAGICQLQPTDDIAPGVIRLYAPQQNLHIILKPGSYDWPKDVWAITSNKQFAPYEQSKLTPG